MNDADAAAATEHFGPRVRRHVADLLRLAWPVMLSRAGILIMAFCDIAMLGRYAAGAIGEANLGVSIFVPLLVVSIGLTSGMVPVVARAYGSGAWAECGQAWRRAVSWALMTSVVAAVVCWQGEALLAAFGQSPELSARGGAVARALAPGLPAQTVYAACAFYLEYRKLWPELVADLGPLGSAGTRGGRCGAGLDDCAFRSRDRANSLHCHAPEGARRRRRRALGVCLGAGRLGRGPDDAQARILRRAVKWVRDSWIRRYDDVRGRAWHPAVGRLFTVA